MYKEDREILKKLEKLIRERKIENFRMCWTSDKYIVRREKYKKSISNADDITEFEKMDSVKEKERKCSSREVFDSFDM